MASTLVPFQKPGLGSLHDASRDGCYWKPVLRGWLDLIWFVASLVAGVSTRAW